MTKTMYALAEELFPICRSITGEGVRATLKILQREIPELTIHEVPSGTEVFDWTVPAEWIIEDAYVENEAGEKVIDFAKTNLSVVGYSYPMDEWMELEDLKKILYTLPNQPEAIPYVTSYYNPRSGFCLSQKALEALPEGRYHAVIKSGFKEEGSLTYGEVILPGETDEEIFFSTYLCHPSMCNDQLSGPVMMAKLIEHLREIPGRRYTYRCIFIPETIGSITYLHENLDHLKSHVKAAFNVACVGDERTYSYMESRYGNTLSDKVARNVLSFHYPDYDHYTFLSRGSDERQYCFPGVDLPVASIARSKFGTYPEYHTSLDDLTLISQEGLEGALDVYTQVVNALEVNRYYRINTICEPRLGKRGLFPTISKKGIYDEVNVMMNFFYYCDGSNDVIDISNITKVPVKVLIPAIEKLVDNGLLDEVEPVVR